MYHQQICTAYAEIKVVDTYTRPALTPKIFPSQYELPMRFEVIVECKEHTDQALMGRIELPACWR